MNLLTARLAELVAQLRDLRQQLRAAIFETIRGAVTRIAGDRLWRPARRTYPLTSRDDPWHDCDDDEPDKSEPRDGTLGTVLRAGVGWWFLYRHSIPGIVAIGTLGCIVSALLGASRVAPAEVIDLTLQAFDTMTAP